MGLKKATVKLGADISEFTSKMKTASRSFKRMGKSMQRVGKSMSMSLTLPLAAFAAASVKAFDTQAKAEAKLLTGLKRNEAAFKSLKKQAQELQKITLYGDEQTMSAQAMLATMGLEEEAIKRLTPLVQDMATAKGMNLTAAADLVAKSVGSSTNALSRYGITIEGAVGSSERLDSAVNALSGQFKGQSEAAAKAGAGGLTQLKNSFGDLMETIGGMLMPVLTKLMDKIKGGIEWFTSLNGKTKTIIVTTGLLLAVLGPIVALLGTMATVIGALLSPIGLAVIAIAAIAAAFIYVRDNWEAFKERLGDWSWWKNSLIQALQWFIEFNPLSLVLKGFNSILKFFGKNPIPNPYEEMAAGLEHLKEGTDNYQHEFKTFGESIKNTASEFGEALSNMGGKIGISTDTPTSTSSDEGGQSAAGGGGILPKLSAMQEKLIALKDASKAFAFSIANDFADSMSQAVVSGKSFLKSMTQIFADIAKQIMRMIVKAAILATLFSFIPGLGAAAKGPTNFTGLLTSGLTGKASGGPVAGNTPYIVGEAGPEIFMSGTAGHITPNHKLGGTIIPDVRISGSDLLIVFNKTRKEEGGVNV